MPSFDVHPILASSDAVGSTPNYTKSLRSSIAVPNPVRGYNTGTITLGTSTSMAPLPTDVKSPALNFELYPPLVNGKSARLECLLTFGGWSVSHAGAGDVRIGARVVNSLNNELVDTGITGVDWLRQVTATGSAGRTRTVILDPDTMFGCYAQLMYAVNGSPSTKSIGYAFVELTPLRWRAP